VKQERSPIPVFPCTHLFHSSLVVLHHHSQGQIPSRSSLPSLARKFLPRELADLFAPAAPVHSVSSSSSSSKPRKSNDSSSSKGKGKGRAEDDDEDDGNTSSSTIKASKPKKKVNGDKSPKTKTGGKGKEKEKIGERSVSGAGKPRKVPVFKRK